MVGCSKTNPGTAATSSAPARAKHAIAVQPLKGNDPAALRSYWQSVKEIQPNTFDVKWNPHTVASE